MDAQNGENPAVDLGGRRLIVVSNRLPVSIKEKDGEYEFTMSSGGLVAALAGLRGAVDMVWLGTPGMPPDGVDVAKVRDKLMAECNCVPVWLSKKIAHEHYNLFSNEVLWPLFHYKENIEFKNKSVFESYTIANRAFCQTVMEVYRPGDLIWVHDYHLMLLPRMIKEEAARKGIKECPVAFFLHVPFPSSEVYRILPERNEILDGVLWCDLIGFHTFDYARHFVHSCTRVLGLETTANEIIFKGRCVTVGVFPVGMDFTKFAQTVHTERVSKKYEELKQRFAGQKVIIGVDRLDYIKGIPQKLLALEQLFKDRPELVGKVSLIQIAVPSREVVEEYQKLRREVEILVGRINTHYGDIGITPVHYLYKSVPFEDLLAMYSVSDICLITSLRDGMNLVAQEFVACQEKNNGVLILSEFAGSARCLAHALRINPWNVGQVAATISDAIDMSAEERQTRRKQLFDYVKTHAAAHWGSSFVSDFVKVVEAGRDLPEPQSVDVLLAEFKAAPKRMLIFAVDGVLSAFKVVASTSVIDDDVMESLLALDSDPTTDVVILSGRKKGDLERIFPALRRTTLAAEHGYFLKHGADAPWVELLGDGGDMGWYDEVLEVLEHYRDRTPGSSLEGRAEGKESTVTWNFRAADSEFGAMQAQELHLHLANHTNHNFIMDLSKVRKSIECRPKGLTVERVISEITRVKENQDYGFTCYFQNEPGEAELSTSSGKDIYTCAITEGLKAPYCSTFCLADQKEMAALLRKLSGLPPVGVQADAAAADDLIISEA